MNKKANTHILREILDIPLELLRIDDALILKASDIQITYYPNWGELYFIPGSSTLRDLLDISDDQLAKMQDEDIQYYYGNVEFQLIDWSVI